MDDGRPAWLEETYASRRQRTIAMVKQAIDGLRKKKRPVSLASIVEESKLLDPMRRGVSQSAVLNNADAYAYYLQHRAWKGTSQPRKVRTSPSGSRFLPSVKPDRDLARVRQRYLRLTKRELVERLIAAEQVQADVQERWLQGTDQILIWQERAELAEAQVKRLRGG